ncbi:IST1 homolog isoform X1 [Ambystoma mexicanum]|uniref:IST1 homolog isoform X1 n=1 Tax=Ambystoma mexicanum TaxID=8296 RepID=UPI0037E8732A
MPGASFKAERLRVNLRLTITHLKLLEKKKTELAQKARKEIADYLTISKYERARIRVEHIIREDYLVEAMEILELYCDLLLARYGMILNMKELDPGMAEAVSSLIWAAPRMLEVSELKIVSKQLCAKYSKEYGVLCRTNQINTVGSQLINKLSTQAPPRILVERYLIEIAKSYNVPYETDSASLAESPQEPEAGPCDIGFTDDVNKRGPSSGGGGGGGFTHTPFSYPTPQKQEAFNGVPVGIYEGWSPKNFLPPQDRPLPQIPAIPATYETIDFPPTNKPVPAGPVAATRSKLKLPAKSGPDTSNNYDNITLPSVPVTPPSASGIFDTSKPEDMDFEDLARRLDDLKKKS